MIPSPAQRTVNLLRHSVSTSFSHRTSTTMASQENREHSARSTTHQNGEGLPHFAHNRGTGNSRVGGRGNSRSGHRGGSGGRGRRGDQGHRGNGAGRGAWVGSNKKKEVGRAEWAYVNQTSSSLSGLIHEVVLHLTEEHATTSELRNDKK